MNNISVSNLADIHENIKYYLGFTLDMWEFVYYVSQITTIFLVAAGFFFTISNLRLTRKNLNHLDTTNKENNLIQREYILQARLIDLSHQWNSAEFIAARNRAVLILAEFEGKDADIQKTLLTKERVDEWVCISMVAHFFLRLSRIQHSDQVDLANARLEFAEAIDFWLEPLLRAYGSDEKEERLKMALKKLNTTYNSIVGGQKDRTASIS